MSNKKNQGKTYIDPGEKANQNSDMPKMHHESYS
jgi:hypothetical protein